MNFYKISEEQLTLLKQYVLDSKPGDRASTFLNVWVNLNNLQAINLSKDKQEPINESKKPNV